MNKTNPSTNIQKQSTDHLTGDAAVVLINLGTPLSPSRKHVWLYLREFFSDKRMIKPLIARLIVKNIVSILRSKPSSLKYQSIWLENNQNLKNKDLPYGSALFLYTDLLAKKIQKALDKNNNFLDYHVFTAMNYAKPDLKSVFKKISLLNCTEVVVIPLFAQYASCTVGSILEKIYKLSAKKLLVPNLRVISNYNLSQNFIDIHKKILLAETTKLNNQNFHVVFSYHGLPVSSCLEITRKKLYKDKKSAFIANNELICAQENYKCCDKKNHYNMHCYRRQCTSQAMTIASQIKLHADKYSICFQSKVGPEKWIEPNIQEIIIKLAKNSKLNKLETIIITMPGFICDCIETLEEIAMEAKEIIKKINPELNVIVLPCLNDNNQLAEFFADQTKILTKDLMHIEI